LARYWQRQPKTSANSETASRPLPGLSLTSSVAISRSPAEPPNHSLDLSFLLNFPPTCPLNPPRVILFLALPCLAVAMISEAIFLLQERNRSSGRVRCGTDGCSGRVAPQGAQDSLGLGQYALELLVQDNPGPSRPPGCGLLAALSNPGPSRPTGRSAYPPYFSRCTPALSGESRAAVCASTAAILSLPLGPRFLNIVENWPCPVRPRAEASVSHGRDWRQSASPAVSQHCCAPERLHLSCRNALLATTLTAVCRKEAARLNSPFGGSPSGERRRHGAGPLSLVPSVIKG
jgi:hypothetical protein